MFQHEADQLVFRPFWISKAERVIGRSLLTQQVTRGNAHRLEQLDEPLARRRVLQIFDNNWLFAALADHRQRVARGPTGGVVIDVIITTQPPLCGRDDAPSASPISRRRLPQRQLVEAPIGVASSSEMRFFR